VPGQAQRPVYFATQKPAADGKSKAAPVGEGAVLYQCPVSAIPSEVWDLLELWWGCRLTGLPPIAGGFMDQPESVRRAFPVFEALERMQGGGAHTAEQAAAIAVASMLKLHTGG